MGEKLKTKLRILTHRLRLLQRKKTENSLKSRREIADFITAGKLDRALIRVEQTIREDFTVEALDLTEGYCDLLLARFPLYDAQKTVDEGLIECVCTLIWASSRLGTDVPEMKDVAKHLRDKYGDKFYEQTLRESTNVNPRIKMWLSPLPPPAALKEKYMMEISKSFELKYDADENLLKSTDDYQPELWHRDAERAMAKAKLNNSVEPSLLDLPDLPVVADPTEMTVQADESNEGPPAHGASELDLLARLARLKGT